MKNNFLQLCQSIVSLLLTGYNNEFASVGILLEMACYNNHAGNGML